MPATQAVLPLVGLAAARVIRDRYNKELLSNVLPAAVELGSRVSHAGGKL
ncbi:MAG: hypothetical protein ACQESR_06085 [Planctomycetota bacterium]